MKSFFMSKNSKNMTFTYIKNEDGNFVCPDCGAIKKNQSTMHYHIKKHEEQLTYVCKDCKQGFLQKQTLDLHIRSKHPGKEIIKKFNCTHDNCTFSALTKGNCIIHYLRVHYQDEIDNIMVKDGNSIMCSECDTEFNSLCAFYYHCKDCIEFIKDTKYDSFEKLINQVEPTIEQTGKRVKPKVEPKVEKVETKQEKRVKPKVEVI